MPSSVGALENFHIISSASAIETCLQKLPKNAIIFVDVDDTIISPRSKTFRVSPHNKLIDNIKKNWKDYPNYQQIVSNWRLQRRVMLLDEAWPAMLKDLKKNFPVYALTKMDTGSFGNIQSMEQWRYEELKCLGIEFSENNEMPRSVLADGQNNPIFYNGIFITGEKSKGQTLEAYKSFLRTDSIVMIDDRVENLEDVQAFCVKHAINFTGILFNGLEKFEDRPDPAVASFQAKYLIEKEQWLEDDEAAAMYNAVRVDEAKAEEIQEEVKEDGNHTALSSSSSVEAVGSAPDDSAEQPDDAEVNSDSSDSSGYTPGGGGGAVASENSHDEKLLIMHSSDNSQAGDLYFTALPPSSNIGETADVTSTLHYMRSGWEDLPESVEQEKKESSIVKGAQKLLSPTYIISFPINNQSIEDRFEADSIKRYGRDQSISSAIEEHAQANSTAHGGIISLAGEPGPMPCECIAY
jgi:hypothetical protein